MPSITIRNVPEETRNVLAARARRSGRSLQEYLLEELAKLVDKPTPEEWVRRVREDKALWGSSLTAEQILEARDAGRK